MLVLEFFPGHGVVSDYVFKACKRFLLASFVSSSGFALNLTADSGAREMLLRLKSSHCLLNELTQIALMDFEAINRIPAFAIQRATT